MKLRAAGIRVVNGTDTGQSRFWIGYFDHLDVEAMVAMGMTPSDAIVAATRDSAAVAGINTGMVAAGKNADLSCSTPIRSSASPTPARSIRSVPPAGNSLSPQGKVGRRG